MTSMATGDGWIHPTLEHLTYHTYLYLPLPTSTYLLSSKSTLQATQVGNLIYLYLSSSIPLESYLSVPKKTSDETVFLSFRSPSEIDLYFNK